jgi:hypothetical protein
MLAQTCLFVREKHDAGVHWTPRDCSRVILFAPLSFLTWGVEMLLLSQIPVPSLSGASCKNKPAESVFFSAGLVNLTYTLFNSRFSSRNTYFTW